MRWSELHPATQLALESAAGTAVRNLRRPRRNATPKLGVEAAPVGSLSAPGRGHGRKPSAHAEQFDFQLRTYRLPPYEREYRFAKHIGRQWRFDFAFLDPYFVAVEFEGVVVRPMWDQVAPGQYKRVTVMTGRHATITGFREDLRKYMKAAELGWLVLRIEKDMVKSGEAIASLQRVLARR